MLKLNLALSRKNFVKHNLYYFFLFRRKFFNSLISVVITQINNKLAKYGSNNDMS